MNIIKYFRGFVLVITVHWLLLSSSMISAKGNEPQKKSPCVFSVHDSNQDGYLDKNEYLLFLGKNYRSMHHKKVSHIECLNALNLRK